MSWALSMQPNMFDLARHYHTLSVWTTEETCSVLFFVCGASRVAALIVNGTFASFAYSPHLRVTSAVAGSFLWGLYAYSFLETFLRTSEWSPDGATSLGPFVGYALVACVELANVRTAAADLGANTVRRA